MDEEVAEHLREIIRKTSAYHCIDCGKCTGTCPISRYDETYSPRRNVEALILGRDEFLLAGGVWQCLTCRNCEVRCPSSVRYSEMMVELRKETRNLGGEPVCSHAGVLQSAMRMMSRRGPTQNRMDWIPSDCQISEKSDVIFFVGCLPYFDAYFTEIVPDTLRIARDTLRVLNAMGVQPNILPDERCCGHDLYWAGEIELFKALMDQNRTQIRASGARTVVTACAECATTLRDLYPAFGAALGCDVKHFSEYVSDAVDNGKLVLEQSGASLTYHDPCRLGRHMGIFEEPRKLLSVASGGGFREMRRNRKAAMCCGTSNWMSCGSSSRMIQLERLREATETGADFLITACPKCQIHFKCTMLADGCPDDARIEVIDLASAVAEAVSARPSKKDVALEGVESVG